MSIYSDNQTKHFYVASANATNNTINGVVKDLEDSDLFRIILDQDNGKKVTSDVINRKLIKKIKINEVKPTYYRKWVVTAPSGNDIADNTTYYVYFYLENMMGFGMQDRWDRVANYTSGASPSAIAIMTGLAKDLWLKLNGAGPIKDDFTIALATRTVDDWDSDTDNESDVTTDGTRTITSKEDGKKVTYAIVLNKDIVTKEGVEKNTFNPTSTATTLAVLENPNSDTFSPLDVTDLRMHTNPYAYNVTMSTGFSKYHAATNNTREYYDEIVPWNDQKQILATNVVNNTPYISSATKVMDMELYFLRNRGDLYDLTKDFYTSILNKNQPLTADATYYTLDIDYAFSDTQGYTYHSDKQLSIACSNKQALQAFKLNILNDNNESAYSADNSVTYTHTNDDDD